MSGMSGVTQARVVRAEWTKLRSLRSGRAALLAAALLIVGLGIVIPAVTVATWSPADDRLRSGFNSFERSVSGVLLAQLVLGVLGVVVITGEYASGTIRATFAAVPRRLPVLWAKLLVLVPVAFVLGAVAVAVAFSGGQAIFASKGVAAAPGDPHVARALLGAPLYLATIAALGLGIGAAVRSTAGGVATLLGLLLVLPGVVSVLPQPGADRIGRYLPSNAGGSLMSLHAGHPALGAWTGFAVLCGYAAVAIALAAVMLVRRDV